jgi:hypothetical protein
MKPEDYNFRDYEHLDRKSPELSRFVGGVAMRFDYLHTLINTFHPPFEAFNHVQHVHSFEVDIEPLELLDGVPLTETHHESYMIFNSEDVIEELRGYRFSEYKRAWPDEIEVEEYFNNETNKLEADLKQIENEVEDFELEDDEPEGRSASDWGFED